MKCNYLILLLFVSLNVPCTIETRLIFTSDDSIHNNYINSDLWCQINSINMSKSHSLLFSRHSRVLPDSCCSIRSSKCYLSFFELKLGLNNLMFTKLFPIFQWHALNATKPFLCSLLSRYCNLKCMLRKNKLQNRFHLLHLRHWTVVKPQSIGTFSLVAETKIKESCLLLTPQLSASESEAFDPIVWCVMRDLCRLRTTSRPLLSRGSELVLTRVLPSEASESILEYRGSSFLRVEGRISSLFFTKSLSISPLSLP